jgi:hypothetical protein
MQLYVLLEAANQPALQKESGHIHYRRISQPNSGKNSESSRQNHFSAE